MEIILNYSDRIFLLGNSRIPTELLFDKRVIPIENTVNLGISRAVNIGMQYAIDEHYEYAVLFDQDSLLLENGFNKLFMQLKNEERFQKVACIGPSLKLGNSLDQTRILYCNKKRKALIEGVVSVKNIVVSGMIVNTRCFVMLNGFYEDFPIDFCDFTFCWKGIHSGFVVLRSTTVTMEHEVGIGSINFIGRKLHFHHPYRCYFMCRDTLFIIFCLRETPFVLRLCFFFQLPLRMLVFLVLLKNRKQRLKMYALGIKDFFCGKREFGSIAHLLGAEAVNQ
jgi:rhamnosyltransferase